LLIFIEVSCVFTGSKFIRSTCDSLPWLAQNAGFENLGSALREASGLELLTAGLLCLICIPDISGMCYNKPIFALAKVLVTTDPKSNLILGSYIYHLKK
jgi:hypothetical protein